jgi:hypothetical protein
MEPSLYRKRPVEVEALQWDPSTAEGIAAMRRFCPVSVPAPGVPPEGYRADLGLDIKTIEGWLRARPGDYVVRGVRGEFYPVQREIFEETYERVEEW